jgi:hypothetical protein
MLSRQGLLSIGCASLLVVTVSAGLGRRGAAPPMPTAPTPPASPRIEKMKQDAAAEVVAMRELTQQMVDQVFSFGELGFQ